MGESIAHPTDHSRNTDNTEIGAPESLLDDTLLLINRVVQAAVTSIVVSDPNLPDCPIVYHNPAFERITGYDAHEIDGRNCRFLQGADTDPEAVSKLRRAIKAGKACEVVLLNYRKDGTPFYNELAVSPVLDEAGNLTHFVGVQNDVTRRTEAENERDLLLAQQQRITETLQRALLLNAPVSQLTGVEVSTQYLPAWDEAQFGGDFFDVVSLSDTKVALVVGDCTGKGLKAAQYTAEVKYALRVLLREYGHPTPALHRLNTFLMDAQRLDARETEALVCVVVAVMDTATGETVIASAGMEPPLVIRANGETIASDARGLMLGLDPDTQYSPQTLKLDAGDTLILLTDGITEAHAPRPSRELFGYDAMTETVQTAQADGLNPDAMGERIVDAAKQFADGKLQDDVCVLLARRTQNTGVHMSVDGVETPVEPAPPENAGFVAEPRYGDLAQFALEVAGLGYWELDTATGMSQRSARHDQIFGYDMPLESWTYERFLAHVHPDDRAQVDTLYARALASGTDWQWQCRIRRASDGAVRWIEGHGRHFGDSRRGDAPTRIVGTVADITGRKITEEELAARREEIAEVHERVTDAVVAFDREWRITFVNPAAEKMLGNTASELLGKNHWELYPASLGTAVDTEYRRAVREQVPVAFEYYYKPWKEWFEIRAFPSPSGLSLYMRDITERRRQESERSKVSERARADREMLLSVLEAMPYGVILAELPDGKIIYRNEIAEALLGGDSLDLSDTEEYGRLGAWHVDESGKPVRRYAPGDYPLVQAVTTGVTVTDHEILYEDGTGNSRWLSVTASPLAAGNDAPTLAIATFNDISGRKQSEREARERGERIVTIFDSITEEFFALDTEWRFTEINRAAERTLRRDRADLLGKTLWEAFPGTVNSVFEREYRRAVDTGKSVTFEEYYPPFDEWLEVRAYPSDAGLSVYYRDISGRKKAEQRERFLSNLADAVRFLSDADAILRETTRLLGEFTGASRVLFCDIRGSEIPDAVIIARDHYTRADTISLAGQSRPVVAFGQAIIDELRTGKVVIITDTETDPRLTAQNRAVFAEYGIRAFIAAPVFTDGAWASLLLVHHDVPHRWAQGDAELVASVAERARLAVENANLRREEASGAERLRLAVGVAEIGTWDMNLSGGTAQSTLDARSAALFGRTVPEGRDTLAVDGAEWSSWIHPLDRERVEREFADALARPDTQYAMEYRTVAPGGELSHWVSARATIERDASDKPLRVVGVCRDITGEKEAANRQRTFLKEMLFGLTEGRLRLCDSEADLPAPLPVECEPVELTPPTLRVLRKQVLSVTETMRFDKERVQDLETAVGEAGMNAVRHAGGGTGTVRTDPQTGVVQIWIKDSGHGIAEHLIHRAVERGWTTGGFGQGMFLMHRTCDRVHLLTGASGTTIVLEQDRDPPIPMWMRNDHG